MTVAAALVLAPASAIALNWGWVAQHGAAAGLPPLSLRTPVRSLRALFGDLSWLVGFLVGIAGWVLYVVAVAVAPLSLVQGISAGGIALLAAFAERRGGHVTRAHWAAVAVATAGLALLAVSLAGGAHASRRPAVADVVLWLVVLGVAAAVASPGGRRLAAGASLGLAAGTLYAAGDVATKAATFGGAWLVLVVVVLAAHGLAFVALQFGFQRGGALATAGTATLLTNALPIAAGIGLFHERLPGGALGVARAVGFGLVVAAAAVLARPDTPGSVAPMQLDPADAEAIPGRSPEREVRILLEDPQLDVTWSRFAGGERGAEPHVHHSHVDGFYVLEGEVTFTVGPAGERVTAGPGTAVLVPPGVVHAFDIDGEATTTYLNFHAPSTGFAAYLRGERDGFDSTDPPAGGGRPAADVLLSTSGAASLDGLTLEVSDVPAGRYADLGAGRFLSVRVD